MSWEMRSITTSYFFGSSMRMPPIFTGSASIPAIFIELIFSTRAGGKVFSMPSLFAIFFTSCFSLMLFTVLFRCLVLFPATVDIEWLLPALRHQVSSSGDQPRQCPVLSYTPHTHRNLLESKNLFFLVE